MVHLQFKVSGHTFSNLKPSLRCFDCKHKSIKCPFYATGDSVLMECKWEKSYNAIQLMDISLTIIIFREPVNQMQRIVILEGTPSHVMRIGILDIKCSFLIRVT